MASLFFSYSRKDIDFARKLTDEFKGQDLDFWIDWESIPPTVEWWEEIKKGIEEADVFLFLLSPDSAKSKVCKQEIEHAAKNGKRLIPIIVSDINANEAPAELQPLNWIFLRENDNFSDAFSKLMTAIKTDYAWVQAHRQLQVKALEWERSNKENSFLLRGKELRDAEYQLATNSSKDPFPTDLQREYVLNSRQAADRQRRVVITIAIAGIIALAALAVFGFIQARLAQNAQATAEVNLVDVQTARAQSDSNAATAQSASTLAIKNESTSQAASTIAVEQKSTAQANEAEAIKQKDEAERQRRNAEEQANIALARSLVVESVGLRASNFELSLLLGNEGFRVYDNYQTRKLLLDNLGIFGNLKISTIDTASNSFAFNPSGESFAAGGASNLLSLWDLTTFKPIGQTLRLDVGRLDGVAFSPDGKILAIGGCQMSLDHEECNQIEIILWDVKTHQPIGHSLMISPNKLDTGDWDSVAGLNYSPNGKTLTAVTRNSIIAWDVETRQPIYQESMGLAYFVMKAAFSPDGETFAFTNNDGNGDIFLWDLNNQQLIKFGFRLSGSRYQDDLVFSPDGRTLATSRRRFDPGSQSNKYEIILWDVETHQPIGQPFKGYSDWMRGMAFSPDGKLLASGSGNKDGIVRLWDVATHQLIWQQQTKYGPDTLAFSPDGTILASAIGISVNLWDVNPQSWLQKGCLRARRNLTQAEWALYITSRPYPTKQEDATCPQWPLEQMPTPTPSP